MSSVECLREFVNERLTAAAEEIFRVFEITIVEYEEEIDRQRRLLDIVWKPEIQLHRIDLPQLHAWKEEEEVLTDQQLSNWTTLPNKKDPEPPQIEKEQEELCTSQEGEQLVLKLETDTFMLTPAYEESDHSEPEPKSDHQLLSHNSHVAESQDHKRGKHGDSGSTRDAETKLKKRHHKGRSHSNNVHSSSLSETHSNTHTDLPQLHVWKEEDVLTDQQLCNQERSSSLDQEDPEPPQIKEEQEELCTSQEGEQLVLKLETDTFMLTPACEESDHSEPESKSDHQLLSHNSHVAESQDHKRGKHEDSGSTRDAETKLKKRHHKGRSHSNNVHKPNLSETHCNTRTGKKSFKCNTCGKECKCKSKLNIHMRIHTGEKPYSCSTCGKRFNQTSGLTAHRRIHTGERPFSCNTCGKRFNQTSVLNAHLRIHTGEKPYSCQTCGRTFRYSGDLTVHTRRAHTGEKPYNCNKCGKRFSGVFELSRHIRVHTRK